MKSMRQNIVFFHPDLGIGGAERLIVDAAVGLQNLGHKVTIFTSHCDRSHCFEEARDGTLDVRVRGNSIVPQTILGRFWILCAILRQLHLILQISLLSSELNDLKPDSFFIDQLSAGVPLLRLVQRHVRVIFYCHFPDKLLAQRGGTLKALYRLPFDWLESWSTGCSDTIVVNSNFTKSVFAQVFPRLKQRQPGVVYPCVDTEQNDVHHGETPIDHGDQLWGGIKTLLSINRFEAKKDVGLAIRAFAGLDQTERLNSRLIIAGGYDPRNAENKTTHASLDKLATSLNLKTSTAKTVISALSIPAEIDVLFLHSVPSAFKTALLKHARLLVYTPRNEHFGIVPLEAMLAETPVLAANEGGPTETVIDGVTGWLRDVRRADDWTSVMRTALSDDKSDIAKLNGMGKMGKARVEAEFSKSKMAERLETEIRQMSSTKVRPPVARVLPENFAELAIVILGLVVGVFLVQYSR
ncbi:UDP-Glycosyltransferase/glycogen phosphorylase [Pseudovirgaria hyperparasitica]|uniref:Alpha-1,3/1,6-mannosyltransferase ALG2 n=1 Tax=Pseudovirgaria hyperparasitica TaxID=470096 RepID=A0A6A6VXQ5_9PEZI|nr:UDP-Glycosyltransferase/glycogen phosphorylase [Pseudovirgaria hyperparasitica]KAF2755392.1 UDP-Glycosyltransferase/glycogen phosphorylase [Pseudovirgaria hyperparasitica]